MKWSETKTGALVIALGLVLFGIAISAGGFALSGLLGAGTTVVAVGPFVVAVRLVARAFRGKLWVLAVFVVALVALAGVVLLMAPYLPDWDPLGEAVAASPLPREQTGEFTLPTGDPGIPGIYGAYVDSDGLFDWEHGDDRLYLRLTPGGAVLVENRFRMPWDGTVYKRFVARCTGSATFEDDGWTLSFTDPHCRAASGRYARARRSL